jgi:hypothetical protein
MPGQDAESLLSTFYLLAGQEVYFRRDILVFDDVLPPLKKVSQSMQIFHSVPDQESYPLLGPFMKSKCRMV